MRRARYSNSPRQNDAAGARKTRRGKGLLGLLCLAFAAAADTARSAASGKLDACAGKKIYIMDIGMFAKENGVPPCNLATVSRL
jgi:hypothetical protein